MFCGQWLRSAESPSAFRRTGCARGPVRCVTRPQRVLREALGQVFGDRQRVPHHQAIVDQHRHPPGRRHLRDARLNGEPASKPSKRTITSSNGMPNCRISTQGRIDHDE